MHCLLCRRCGRSVCSVLGPCVLLAVPSLRLRAAVSVSAPGRWAPKVLSRLVTGMGHPGWADRSAAAMAAGPAIRPDRARFHRPPARCYQTGSERRSLTWRPNNYQEWLKEMKFTAADGGHQLPDGSGARRLMSPEQRRRPDRRNSSNANRNWTNPLHPVQSHAC